MVLLDELVNFEGSHTCVLRPVLPSKAKKRIEASLVPQVRGFRGAFSQRGSSKGSVPTSRVPLGFLQGLLCSC